MRHSLLAVIPLSLWSATGCAEMAVIDNRGRVSALSYDGESLTVQTDLRIPRVGWTRLPGLEDARDVETTRDGQRRVYSGRIEVEPGKSCAYEQTLEEAEGTLRIGVKVTAEADIATEGVYYWLEVPIAAFAGGEASLTAAGARVGSAEMPREQPANRHFLAGDADRLTMTDAVRRTELDLSLDRALPITVQDTREWQGTVYSAFLQLAPGPLKQGQVAEVSLALKVTGEADRSPAELTLDPGTVRYRLDGFGGNYCFGIESPITQYTLDNLNIAWARTEMTPTEWEPENDNASPEDTNWELLESHDQPNSNLRREFLLAQQIQKRDIPYLISIWHLPDWLYAPPGPDSKRVDPGKWPELLECLGSYLTYAKKQYGVEPDLFCFNEANIGVYTLFSPEEHREALKLIGAHFEKLGLRTKMLLGDATGPRGTHTYVGPAAADPEAMRYVGAVGFHSWGGGSREDYEAWGDIAERLKLPLLVAELGVDAGAWRTAAYDSFHYAVQEVRMYQELLLYARPQGTMQWEFTSDYGIVKEGKDAAGQVALTPTVRFWFVKHFCNLTPQHSEALITTSDHEKVLFTAFRAGDTLTLHLANLGAEREATLIGLPAPTFRRLVTSETQAYEELDPVSPQGAQLTLDLPALSLVTLTTAPRVGASVP